MKKILILGSGGLLGSALCRLYPELICVDKAECDITKPNQIYNMLKTHDPEVIINCAGIVPKNPIKNDIDIVQINSLAPHWLSIACDEIGCQLIHISTDCVFSGTTGGYKEDDIPCANTIYGISKFLGEVVDPPHVTIRTSFVGLPDPPGRGLLAWLKSNEGQTISGYTKSMWNGLTVLELAKQLIVIADSDPPFPFGLYHLHAEKSISKYDLLTLAADVYELNVKVEPSDSVEVDRTLASNRLSPIKKTYEEMFIEMKDKFDV